MTAGAASAGGKSAAEASATVFGAGLAGLAGFGDATSCSGALGVALASALGAVVSVLATTRCCDLGDSLVGRSSFGVAASGVATTGSTARTATFTGGVGTTSGAGAARRGGVGGSDQRPVRAHGNRLHRLGDRKQRRDRSRGDSGRHNLRFGRRCDRRAAVDGERGRGRDSAGRAGGSGRRRAAAASGCADRPVVLRC